MITAKTRMFAILWVAGMTGVLSLLLIDLTALLANLPATAGAELPFSPQILKLVSLVQPTILMSIAAFIGVQLASQVGLSAPAAEALARGDSFIAALKPQVLPGIIAGVLAGIAIVSTWLLFRPFLPPVFVTRAEKLNTSMPLLTRLLYGGVTEELLLRWGLLTLLVWAAWWIFQRRRGKPRTIYLAGAILISSIVFGIGHLPIVPALQIEFTLSIVAYIVMANSLFGLIAGFLYWWKGLEAAIVAHMTTHLVIITTILFLMPSG